MNKYERHLRSKGALNPSVPSIVQLAVDCINTRALPKMKISVAVSELVTFASQLRKPIQFDKKLVVTTNSINFTLARSGAAKDSSVKAVRRALKPGYDKIQDTREREAKLLAQEKAIDAGEEPENYYKYIKRIRALLPEMGTAQGMVSHFANLAEGSVGAGYINTSEVGSDLLSNKDMPLVLTLLAKAYDVGDIPSTIVKADENQVDEISGFPVNALFFGTESVILYDPKVKEMFKQVFSAQLARRSDFSFNPGELPPIDTDLTVDEEIDLAEQLAEQTHAAQDKLEAAVGELVDNTNTTPLEFSREASRLFETYLRYNELAALDIPKVYPISEIARKHYQWRAMKLSAVYAIYDNSEVITAQHFIDAINTIELFSGDLMAFEQELNKDAYEHFADFMGSIAENNSAFLSIHELRKLGYVATSSEARLNELAKSATSYDKAGIYTVSSDGIHYECISPVDTTIDSPFTTSYLYIEDDMSKRFQEIYTYPTAKMQTAKDKYKQYLGSIIKSGYETCTTSFATIADALSTNCAISNYLFTDGVRGKANLINSTNWLLFDIDTTSLSIDSVHYILNDINHHLVRGSDDNNDFKYHLAIELSSTLEIEPRLWKHFMKSVATYLGIQHDELPQSQVMFCYGGRDVLSVTDQSTLDIKDHILAAQAQGAVGPVKELTPAEKKKLLTNSFSTFDYAFECVDNGSRNLIRAGYHARDLGMPVDDILTLVQEISSYWDYPMPQDRLEQTILSQIRSW